MHAPTGDILFAGPPLAYGCHYAVTFVRHDDEADAAGLVAYEVVLFCDAFRPHYRLSDLLVPANLVSPAQRPPWVCSHCLAPSSVGCGAVCTNCAVHRYAARVGQLSRLPLVGAVSGAVQLVFSWGRQQIITRDPLAGQSTTATAWRHTALAAAQLALVGAAGAAVAAAGVTASIPAMNVGLAAAAAACVAASHLGKRDALEGGGDGDAHGVMPLDDDDLALLRRQVAAEAAKDGRAARYPDFQARRLVVK